jgi:hypothetical protein
MSFKKSMGLGAVAAATLLALPAVAKDYTATAYNEEEHNRSLTNDFSVSLSGGLNTYTGDLADATGVGGFLGLQADARPLPLMGIELGYENSRNPFANIDGSLWRYNVDALAKVGPQLGVNGNLRPFVGAGFGVSILDPSGDSELFYDNDFVTEVPLAAGVDYNIGAVRAGARATYSILGGENLGRSANGNDVNFGVNVGGRF